MSAKAMKFALPYSSTMANVHEEKVQSAKESARVLVEAIRKGIKPRDIVTRLNAISQQRSAHICNVAPQFAVRNCGTAKDQRRCRCWMLLDNAGQIHCSLSPHNRQHAGTEYCKK